MKILAKKVWERVFGDSFILRAYQRSGIETALKTEGGAMRMLDVGAGELGLTCRLKHRHPTWDVTACDLSVSRETMQKAERAGIDFVATDGSWLPRKEGGFDVVLMSSVLQMVPDPAFMLKLCRKSLAFPLGRLVFTVPAHYHFITRACISRSRCGAVLRKLFDLPETIGGLHAKLKSRFGVLGPQGCYTRDQVEALLNRNGFTMVHHSQTPGWWGTLAWEGSLLFSLRWGSGMFALMGVLYPFARLGDFLNGRAAVGEHLVVARVADFQGKSKGC